ncbi:hypothetical protein HWV62_14528 [Athelia sp. TMB]|nr:hypothetical protein HWV62_14528 [Athelia sp. TMB]
MPRSPSTPRRTVQHSSRPTLQTFKSQKMSPIQTILGFWRSTSTASSSSNTDLEAQNTITVISGTHSPLPISLAAPAATHTFAPTSRNAATNPVDDFFGVTRTVRDSRHDDVRMPTPSEELPPPYLCTSRDEEGLPAYDAPLAEPTTLAQYLFRFGFCEYIFYRYRRTRAHRPSLSVLPILDTWSHDPPFATVRPCRLPRSEARGRTADARLSHEERGDQMGQAMLLRACMPRSPSGDRSGCR